MSFILSCVSPSTVRTRVGNDLTNILYILYYIILYVRTWYIPMLSELLFSQYPTSVGFGQASSTSKLRLL